MLKLSGIRKRVSELFSQISKSAEDAGQYFDDRKAGLLELSMLPWFQYIVHYRENEVDNAMLALADPKTKQEDLDYLRAKYWIAVKFLEHLHEATQ